MICLENKKRNSMLRDKQRKISRFLPLSLVLLLAIIPAIVKADLTTLAKNDPIPVFTTLNLDDALLLTRKQLLYKFDALDGWDYEWADQKCDHINISISPFAQNADRGKTIKGSRCPTNIEAEPNPNSCPTRFDTPLGDLTGRTDMIALLYNNGALNTNTLYPQGQTLAPLLQTALDALFPAAADGTRPGLNDEANIDPTQQLGFFEITEKYRKRGLRIEASGLLWHGMGLRIQGGFSTIRQVQEEILNLTNNATDTFDPKTPTVNQPSVNTYLMEQLKEIARQLQIGFCNDFIETSLEDLRFNLFWRDMFPVNEGAESKWARFLAIPYAQISGSISPVKKDDYRNFFAAPFGNNGHKSFGMTAGINLDFIETIEIGGEIGFTHFFKRDYCNMPVPTNRFQNNLYPFSTNVSIHPGENWYFCARLAAYQFLDRLSMHFEWYVLDHQPDHIALKVPDTAFVPESLECKSSFKVKLGNVALNYDFSPNFNIGLLWQIPFSQRNAYRSSTVMAGINITF
jgi:hypothetical protein